MDRRVSLVIGGFEFALGPMRGVWKVMKSAISKRSAEAFVEEQEQQATWMPLPVARQATPSAMNSFSKIGHGASLRPCQILQTFHLRVIQNNSGPCYADVCDFT